MMPITNEQRATFERGQREIADARERARFYRQHGLKKETVRLLNRQWHAAQQFLARHRPDLCARPRSCQGSR